jgi:hypothetical protein
MPRDWLYSRFGINFVAIGLVAALVAVPVIVIQDASFLVTGVWPKLPSHREVLYHLLAAVAAVFSAGSFFVFRPGLARVVAVVVAISFGSYVVQPFAILHSHQVAALCVARIFGFCTLLLLVRAILCRPQGGESCTMTAMKMAGHSTRNQ